jgi:hypothetical protein
VRLDVPRAARTHVGRAPERALGRSSAVDGARTTKPLTTMTETETVPSADSWTSQLEQLRARYKHVRPPILAALNILIHDQNIALDDAKAHANLHGVRITAASMAAARTLWSRMDARADASAVPATPSATGAPDRVPRRPRGSERVLDAEDLVRGLVAKLQSHGNVEAHRLRDGIRRAIAVLQAAVG